jgi:hypothetical protein
MPSCEVLVFHMLGGALRLPRVWEKRPDENGRGAGYGSKEMRLFFFERN